MVHLWPNNILFGKLQPSQSFPPSVWGVGSICWPEGCLSIGAYSHSTLEVPALSFQWQGYKFCVLLFGLAISPHVFTRMVKAGVGQQQILTYLDNELIPSPSLLACLINVHLVLDMILWLGFIPVAEETKFVGVIFDRRLSFVPLLKYVKKERLKSP